VIKFTYSYQLKLLGQVVILTAVSLCAGQHNFFNSMGWVCVCRCVGRGNVFKYARRGSLFKCVGWGESLGGWSKDTSVGLPRETEASAFYNTRGSWRLASRPAMSMRSSWAETFGILTGNVHKDPGGLRRMASRPNMWWSTPNNKILFNFGSLELDILEGHPSWCYFRISMLNYEVPIR